MADTALEAKLLTWMPMQRWFAAKGSAITSVRITARERLMDTPDFAAEHLLVAVELTDPSKGPIVQTYQVPLGFRRVLPPELEAWALPAESDATTDLIAYDGLRDPEIISLYSDLLAAGHPHGEISFRTVPGETVEHGLTGRVLGAEQSNTSVILGDKYLLKIFRQIAPGVNPDVELHRALASARCINVAPLKAWMETSFGGSMTTLSMAQEFVGDSVEGWKMALDSVADLQTETGDQVGDALTKFARESFHLGAAVAQVHVDLASEVGSMSEPASSTTIDDILARIEAAVDIVPALATFIPAVRKIVAEAESGPEGNAATVQRIHGDLHLGQVLRTGARWLLIDFEGEPAKSLDERRQMDSPLRDVAGMLRSYDYAAHNLTAGVPDAETAGRLDEWTAANTAAFCDGYASVTGLDPRDRPALLRAYELDKAVYEAVYEARNRPTWLDIPMNAIRRLTSV